MRFFALALILSLVPSTADRANESGDRIRKDVLLLCDFETDDWWRAWGIDKPPVNTSLVTGEGAFKGRSLKVTVPRGEHMGTSFAYKFRQQTGAEPEEIYFRYYLKFDPSWSNATSGGKLPGISGTYGRAGWGGRRVNGSDGWSARGLFDTRSGAGFTTVGFYCYHADMKGKYGEHWAFKPSLEHGRWYSIEQYCKLNTPADAGGKGRNDGILRGWIDGELAFEKTDIRFRDVDTLGIENIWMNVYHGGETPVPRDDIHLYLDNIVIARAPIGPGGQVLPKAFVDGTGPGWRSLSEKDFVNVNCQPETWTWKDDVLHCTGQPIGVLRTQQTLTNFELVVEWQHLRSAGNSGVFVWVSEESLKNLKPDALPHGIEVQILDHGYREQYEKRSGKKADWFTTDGDVFPVGQSKMKPFPPTSPNGARSFPRKQLSKGIGEWNHYYVRGINGEVRLWVNGEEVSGGSDAEPRRGYLCLESEGSPIQFKNIRIRELP